MKELGTTTENKKAVIIGAGPAGLTAAYELCKAGVESVVLEKDKVVGGIARTVNYRGYHFDIGGHRFFTKVKAVENMWHEVLGDDFLERTRLSRIYYDKKFFYYPLRATNALFGLGLWNSFLILISYIRARLFPAKPELSLEQWVSNRFGKRLYNIFFKTYTEKVWGIPCSEIRAEWAAQRIKGLSLVTALKSALLKNQNSDNGAVIKTLIDSFHYPKLGPGMMWQRVTDMVQERGSHIRLEAEVEKILWSENKITGLEVKTKGRSELITGTHFISSMPVRELIQKFEPAVPEPALRAAMKLNYRDFLTVVLIIDKPDVFPDNWIYIHDPDVRVGRIQNFKNWSPYMVPDPNKTCLGLEYFCFEGDGMWCMPDQELIDLAKKELDISGLVDSSDVVDGTVVRMPKSYPIYDSTYLEALQTIRIFLRQFENLQLVGRNGMHKYNNQDHSMLTAMLAAKNILGASHDLWQVNADQEYHEELREGELEDEPDELSLLASTQPSVPVQTLASESKHPSIRVLIQAFGRMDKLALATAVGTVSGLVIFLATLWLITRGDKVSGAGLHLLGEYFIGYTVSVKGSFIGLGYSFLTGFFFGWLFAYLRNLFLGIVVYRARKEAESLSTKNLLDYI